MYNAGWGILQEDCLLCRHVVVSSSPRVTNVFFLCPPVTNVDCFTVPVGDVIYLVRLAVMIINIFCVIQPVMYAVLPDCLLPVYVLLVLVQQSCKLVFGVGRLVMKQCSSLLADLSWSTVPICWPACHEALFVLFHLFVNTDDYNKNICKWRTWYSMAKWPGE